MNRREFLKSAAVVSSAAATGVAAPAVWSSASAQSARQETLLLVSESGPNNLDIHGVGTNRPGYEVAWNCYDRLMSYGTKTMPDGTQSYDRDKLVPELAEEWDLKPDSVTFKLRKDATFHDGSPVTAQDVKWSFDRAVSVGGFPTVQMKAGSLEKPEQFVAVDDHTFRVDFIRPDRLTMPDLAVIVPSVFNSRLVQSKATEQDKWGLEYTKQNTAGGGAYKVTKWQSGTEVLFERNDSWKCGPMPALKRVVWRMVPSAGNRRALIERGDADISFDLPAKDFVELDKEGKVKVISNPISNGIQYIGMNVTKPPFDKLGVRQAVAYALPYQKIMDAVLFGLAKPLYGAKSNTVSEPVWPQAHAYDTDIAKAKELMAKAGYADGFETTLSFDLGSAAINEPLCTLVQESLGQIGIKVTLNKIPGANWRGELIKKEMPLISNFFSGWLDYPEYFFFWCYHGQNTLFNTMSYKNPAMDKLIDGARAAAAAADWPTYNKDVDGFIDIAFADVPRVPLYQPYLSVAMQKPITGYQYWFHRQLDYRTLKKG
ncbi:ABC transporter substrate-binding protein [Ancylobacter sp. MQZ15Z-1]|uniref:ABC transporter substrate-binding protein n=1 Tax=Ancylobacter mangrovi TaxID=2972472 RepID=A0A9X2PH45_9HYPH|nr:ABC transporter substrate-binding protein [Ancylobacter mangrovi]MCS0494413.1 ABC transporter substrate-binding protein [Ancylobacter mangrovi]